MSKLELIRSLYEYNEWANNQMLDAVSGLTAEQRTGNQGASFDSIERNIGHIVAAQMNWLERWTTGKNTTSTVELQRIQGFDALRASFGRSHEALRQYIASLSDERLDGLLEYRDSRGTREERPLWQLMSHVVNHGTHHRAETAMALAAIGKPMRELDYVYFELERVRARN